MKYVLYQRCPKNINYYYYKKGESTSCYYLQFLYDYAENCVISIGSVHKIKILRTHKYKSY